MTLLDLQIEGIGFWAPGWPNWDAACAGLRRGDGPAADAPARPAPGLLPPAERRRAPEPVLLACEVASQACEAAGREGAELPSVFASTHGDLAITDYMCSTLATAPHELSPIRFHNSVHNAPAGYWTIATRCHRPSTSISGWTASFGAALFEAAVQAVSGDTPVLLVAYDTESRGPLADVSPSTPLFGTALVLAPFVEGSGLSRLRIGLDPDGVVTLPTLPPAFAAIAAGNPTAAHALPFLCALVSDLAGPLHLPGGQGDALRVECP